MATERGDAWPYYVVIAKNDKRLRRHPTRAEAETEARRLVQKENTPMTVLRVVDRFEPAPILVVQREIGPEQYGEAQGQEA